MRPCGRICRDGLPAGGSLRDLYAISRFRTACAARSRPPRSAPSALPVCRPRPANPRTLIAGLPAWLPSPFHQLTGLRGRSAPRLRSPPPPLSTSWLAVAGLTIGFCLQASGLAPFVPLTVAQSLRAEPPPAKPSQNTLAARLSWSLARPSQACWFPRRRVSAATFPPAHGCSALARRLTACRVSLWRLLGSP